MSDGGYFFLHKRITPNIFSNTNMHCVYQYKYVDPAYRYRCAIFCTQVLFLNKRKHHSRLISTAKAKRKQINEFKSRILIVFLFVLFFLRLNVLTVWDLKGHNKCLLQILIYWHLHKSIFTFVDPSLEKKTKNNFLLTLTIGFCLLTQFISSTNAAV